MDLWCSSILSGNTEQFVTWMPNSQTVTSSPSSLRRCLRILIIPKTPFFEKVKFWSSQPLRRKGERYHCGSPEKIRISDNLRHSTTYNIQIWGKLHLICDPSVEILHFYLEYSILSRLKTPRKVLRKGLMTVKISGIPPKTTNHCDGETPKNEAK